jgi:glycerol-3-phosphate dehydrogenase
MAKMAVDRIVEREGRDAPCRTDEIPLGQPEAVDQLEAVEGVDSGSAERLAARYGHAAHGVLAVAAERPEWARRIVPDLPDLVAEAPFAVRNEQAATVADVLLRRTRLGLLDAGSLVGPASEGARGVAEAMAVELGWDGDRVERELEAWRETAAAEGICVPAAAPAAT